MRSRNALSFQASIDAMHDGPAKAVAQAVIVNVSRRATTIDGRRRQMMWSDEFLRTAWSIALEGYRYKRRRGPRKSASPQTYAAIRARAGVSAALRILTGLYWSRGRYVSHSDVARHQLSTVRDSSVVRHASPGRSVFAAAPARGVSSVEDIISTLPPLERWLVRGHYLDGRTYADLSLPINLSPQRVQQIVRRAIVHLRSIHPPAEPPLKKS